MQKIKLPEKKKYGERAVIDELVKKAIEARDDEAKKAKSLLSRLKPKVEPKTHTEPRIPGVNRAMVRRYIKQQKKAAALVMRKAKRKAETVEEVKEDEPSNN